MASATDAFDDAFGHPPGVCAWSPGRVNLMGDHTDYNEGLVLPMAIDRWTVMAASPSAAGESQFISSVTGRADGGGFSRYVQAVAAELGALGWPLPIVDVFVHSSVPIGSGLASSAALVVAAATMFESLASRSLTSMEKAKLCQRAEHRCGTPCGIMDMFAVTHARAGRALLLDCRSLAFEHVPLPTDWTWLVVNTGVRHELSGGAYADRRARCERAATKLGVTALRDVSASKLTAVSTALSEDELRCARHVVSENERTRRAAEAIRAGDLSRLSEIMFASHASLADDFGVSCPELDAVVEVVRSQGRGAGARMTGAGFGGCAIVATPSSEVEGVLKSIANGFSATFGRLPETFRVDANGPAGCHLGRSEGTS